MKTRLFPYTWKKPAAVVFFLSLISGLIVLFKEPSFSFLDFQVPALQFKTKWDESYSVFTWKKNNLIEEIVITLIIISGLISAFSREKEEDEYIRQLRFESLMYAVFLNYIFLFVSNWFFYDFDFMFIMSFNMFTILIFFIIRFNYVLYKNRKKLNREESN